MVAYEMARQVLEAGGEVAYLGLVEPTPAAARDGRITWLKAEIAESGISPGFILFLIRRFEPIELELLPQGRSQAGRRRALDEFRCADILAQAIGVEDIPLIA